MKNKNRTHPILNLGPALVLVPAVVGCASSGPRITQEQKFIQLHHVANTGAELNLKKGDAVAMVCTKLQDGSLRQPRQTAHAIHHAV